MAEDIKVNNLIINQLSNEKFATIEKDPTQLYLTPDTSIDASEKGVAGGVATLDSSAKVPTNQIPALPYLPTSGGTVVGTIIITPNAEQNCGIYFPGYNISYYQATDRILFSKNNAGLLIEPDGTLKQRQNNQDHKLLNASDKAIPNGVASLGADGKVPAEQLPLSSTGGKSVGEVFFSQSASATDNPGALPLWTGEYYSNASSLYPDFYNWVKSHTELCKTKEEYDSAIATYGECPFYVVDEVAGSLRLPRLANYLKMANDTDGVTQSGAGLPNITGEIGSFVSPYPITGAFTSAVSANTGQGGSGQVRKAIMDASKSSPVYGKSDTVTPAHTTLYPWVVAYTAAIPASEAQAAEFTGALSGKANTDLSNVSSNIDYVVESYSDESGNWYRVYKSRWIEQGGLTRFATSGTSVTFLKPFLNDTYSITTGAYANDIYTKSLNIYNKTATTFVGNATTDGAGSVETPFSWYACGQGS